MVAAPWRRLSQVARWNGHAPHVTTGAASTSESHCQLRNCRAGTMAMAVNCAYRRDRVNAARLMFVTALFGITFVGMQAFEWSKLIVDEGIRPWGNPAGAAQFGASFFMITGFHGMHVTVGVIYLVVVAVRLLLGRYEHSPNYQIVEIAGLYWHFVDLVWVFIFALFYLW